MKRYLFLFLGIVLTGQLLAQLTLDKDSLQTAFDEDINLEVVEVNRTVRNIDSRGLGNMRINMNQVRLSPLFLGERDVIKTLQFLPGVSSGMEGSSQLNIRGGTNDQTLYLMDGVPVYNQNHTFGFFSIFNTDAVESAEIYKGGIPSFYGDKLSGVVSVGIKDGDFRKYNHSFSLGLLAMTFTSNGPVVKDKLSYMVAARRSFFDLLYNGIMTLAQEGGGGSMIAFYDINAKLSWKINPKSMLSWQAYTGYDDLYGMNYSSETYFLDNGQKAGKKSFREKFGYGWKSMSSSLRYTSQLNPNLLLTNTLYYTGLNNFNYYRNKEKTPEYKSTYENTLSSLLDELGLRTSFNHKINDRNTLSYGIDASYQTFRPDYVYKKTNNAKIEYNNSKLKLASLSTYIYDELNINGWLLGLGLRTSLYHNREKTRIAIDPRLKINTFLGDKNKLMLAYDRMHQPVHTTNEMNYNVQTDYWIPFKENHLPNSHQLSVGWKNYTTPDLSFSIESYYKKMNNLLMIRNLENYLDFHTDYETGNGESMGVEFMLEYTHGRLTAWGSYALSKSTRDFGGKSYRFKYDAPHDLSAFAGYTVRENEKNRNTLSANLQYRSGYPYYVPELSYPSPGLPTLPSGFGGLNNIYTIDYIPQYPNIRLKNYFRLDLNFTMQQKLKHGSRTWQFSILNVTNQNNPYAIYKKDGKYKAFILIPFFPSFSFTRNF